MAALDEAKHAASIVSDAGGRIVGRTRLQKIAFIFEAAGVGAGFSFRYRHYGPYSDELTTASRMAVLLGMLQEVEHPASWGGFYSTFTSQLPSEANLADTRQRLAQETVSSDAIDLELMATALFLACEGAGDPWGETAHRKPDKATSTRLDRAKELYRRVRAVRTPRPLPAI